jgi:CIC family chloride channel protein
MNPFLKLNSLRKSWQTSRHAYQSISMFRIMILSVLTGLGAGLFAIIFFFGIEGLRFLFLHQLAGIFIPVPSGEALFSATEAAHPGSDKAWLIPILTTSVGLLTGWLVQRLIPECQQDGATDGTDVMTRSFHQERGVIRPLSSIIKGSTAILTIASGCSAGREGPITHIGAGLGSWLSSKLRLSARERRILLLAGAGGALGAIFRAPLGGAITAVEIIYKEDFESEALLPAIISSVIAYTLYTLVFGDQPLFNLPDFTFHPRELPFYVLLALFCSLSAWFYVKTFFGIKYRFFQPFKRRYGLILTTGLGGLMMGLLGMLFPHLLSGGYGWLEMAILGKLSIVIMLGLLVGKTLATSITIGSEMSGGMFAPALFVGGMSGGLIGKLGDMYFPSLISHPGAYVLVGMAAFFSGAGSAPIGPFIIVSELTQHYGLLAPLMLTSAICIFINRKFSLYENQLDNKFQSPSHSGELFVDVLQAHTVSELLPQLREAEAVSENMNFSDFKQLFRDSEQHYFPVVNENDELTGIFSSTDFRGVLFEQEIENLVLVKDIAISGIITTSPSEDLSTVMTKFTQKNLDALPVVEDEDHRQLLGMLRRREVIHFYNQQLEKIKTG